MSRRHVDGAQDHQPPCPPSRCWSSSACACLWSEAARRRCACRHRPKHEVLVPGVLRGEVKAGAVRFPLHALRRRDPVDRRRGEGWCVDVHHRRACCRSTCCATVGRSRRPACRRARPWVVVGPLRLVSCAMARCPRSTRRSPTRGMVVAPAFARREEDLLTVGRELDAVVVPVAVGQRLGVPPVAAP